MSGFVKSIVLAKTGGKASIEPAYPKSVDQGVINILCGLNNTGKTYILRRLRSILSTIGTRRRGISSELHVEMSEPTENPPKILYLGKSWQNKESVGVVPIQETSLKLPGDRSPYRHARLAFLREQVLSHMGTNEIDAQDHWFTDSTHRVKLTKKFALETRLYRCQKTCHVLTQVENILGIRIYFRRSQEFKFEFVALTPQETMVPYQEWSDGHKAVFYLLIMLDYVKPDILLLDEIETHLHPQYMTAVLSIIKQMSRQSFITTHHPHVIFSELSDRVFFLDTEKHAFAQSSPKELIFRKTQQQSVPVRTVQILTDSFDKVSASYQLFDRQDAQLFRQAGRIANDAERMFYRAVLEIFTPEVLTASPRMLPDRQTQFLADAVREIGATVSDQTVPITILDIGSGVGRVAKELTKLSTWKLGTEVRWVCWEPNDALRSELKKVLSAARINATVMESTDNIALRSCQVVILANVIHELPPDSFVDALILACNALVPAAEALLVIMEIYPLRRAEQFSVAYPYGHLLSMLNNLGFNCTLHTFPIQDAQGYCVLARPPLKPPNKASIRSAIKKVWEHLELEICSSYACQRRITSYDDYRRLIQELTTLASMAAFRHGRWKQHAGNSVER